MRRFVVILVVLFIACTNETSTGEINSLSSLDSNAANNIPGDNTDKILIQAFTQIPSIIHKCGALFVKDTAQKTTEYFFVSNLKGIAFIKLNNRLMELKLVRQTNIDKFTVNELYMNDEVEVDLKIKQTEDQANGQWNYNGVLIVTRGSQREAINISGKLGC